MDNITVDYDTTYQTIIIKNINNYHMQILNNNLIITKQIQDQLEYISYEQLIKKNLRHSQIINIQIDNQYISNITKYNKLLKYIYLQLDITTIITNTIISISNEEKNDKGFVYYPDIKLSIRGVDAKTALKEIINQLTKSNKTLEIKIKLKSDEIIYYKSNQ